MAQTVSKGTITDFRDRSAFNNIMRNNRAISNYIEDDRASKIGITFGSAKTVVVDELGFRKIRWTPSFFYQPDATESPRSFTISFVAILVWKKEFSVTRYQLWYETPMHRYLTEPIHVSMEWKEKEPAKDKTRIFTDKITVTIFWNF